MVLTETIKFRRGLRFSELKKMTFLSGLLITSDRRSCENSFKCPVSEIPKYISTMIQATDALTITACPDGLMFHCIQENAPENPTATSLVKNMTIRGSAYLLGPESDTTSKLPQSTRSYVRPTSVGAEAVIKVKQLCHETVRSSLQPKRPRSAYQYFQTYFSKMIKAQTDPNLPKPATLTEWGPQTMQAWRLLSPEERQKFIDEAQKGKEEYEAEKAKFNLMCRPCPRRARHAYNIFMMENGGKNSDGQGGVCKRDIIAKWRALSPEQQAPYIAEAGRDMERYKRENEDFKKWCLETNSNYDELMRKKKKVPTIRRTTEPAKKRPPTEKKKVESDPNKKSRRARAVPSNKKEASSGNNRKRAPKTKPGAKKRTNKASQENKTQDEDTAPAKKRIKSAKDVSTKSKPSTKSNKPEVEPDAAEEDSLDEDAEKAPSENDDETPESENPDFANVYRI